MDNLFSACGDDNDGFREWFFRKITVIKKLAKVKTEADLRYRHNTKIVTERRKLERHKMKREFNRKSIVILDEPIKNEKHKR